MIQIRKSDTRGHANLGWLDSRFSFSFAEYFDPLNGAPLRGSRFSWTAAMYLHLAAE